MRFTNFDDFESIEYVICIFKDYVQEARPTILETVWYCGEASIIGTKMPCDKYLLANYKQNFNQSQWGYFPLSFVHDIPKL